MNYFDLIPVSELDELNAIADKKFCKTTPEQFAKVKEQVAKVYGDTKIAISPRGVVFAQNDDVSTIGRVLADFTFISKH